MTDAQGKDQPPQDRTIEDRPAATTSAGSPLIGKLIDGRFKLRLVLGEGGMGSVYLAEDQKLSGRRTAVKIMSPRLTADPEFRARFEREAVLQANLPHPQIIQIADMGECVDGAYIVMEYSDGRSLSRLIRELGPREPASALNLVAQILEVLDFAHGQGVVHRDLKPSNILVEERPGKEIVRLLDFGIAKLLGDRGQSTGEALTRTGFAYGTLGYMAPEQARGETDKIDHRADLYAVGIMLYEMLTGDVPAPPESRGHPVRYAMWCQENSIAPLSESHPDLGLAEQVDEILKRALRRDPAERYPSALAFLSDVREFVESGSVPTVARRLPVPRTGLETRGEVTANVPGDRGGRAGVFGWVLSVVLIAALGYGYGLWKNAEERAKSGESALSDAPSLRAKVAAAERIAEEQRAAARSAQGTLDSERETWRDRERELERAARKARSDQASAEQTARLVGEQRTRMEKDLEDKNRAVGELQQQAGQKDAIIAEKQEEITRLTEKIRNGVGDETLKSALALAQAAKEKLEKQVVELLTRPTRDAHDQLELAKNESETARRDAVKTANAALGRASEAEAGRAAAAKARDDMRRWIKDNAAAIRRAVAANWPPPGILDAVPTPGPGGGKIVVENGESQQIFIKSVKARTPSGSEDLVTAAEVVFTGDGLEIARLPAGTTALVVVYDGSYDKNSRRYRRKNLTKSFQVGPGVTKFSIPSR